MKYIILCLLSFLLLLHSVFALDEKTCLDLYNISCENCAAINLRIIGTEGDNTLFVGDTFYYDIELKNIGNETLNQTFFVSVYSPTNKTLSQKVYKDRFITSNGTIHLIPNQTEKIYDIYPFDISGSYVLEIDSTGLIFYRFYEGCLFIRYPHAYILYFDAMPQWQYKLNKNFEQVQKSNLELLNQSSKLLEESVVQNIKISSLTEDIVNLSRKLENLTIALLILAFIPVTIELWKHSKKYWKPLIGSEGIFLTLIGFLFIYSFFILVEVNLIGFIIDILLILLFLGLPSYLLLSGKTYKNKALRMLRNFGIFELFMVNIVLVVYSIELARQDVILGTILALVTIHLLGLVIYGEFIHSKDT